MTAVTNWSGLIAACCVGTLPATAGSTLQHKAAPADCCCDWKTCSNFQCLELQSKQHKDQRVWPDSLVGPWWLLETGGAEHTSDIFKVYGELKQLQLTMALQQFVCCVTVLIIFFCKGEKLFEFPSSHCWGFIRAGRRTRLITGTNVSKRNVAAGYKEGVHLALMSFSIVFNMMM